MVEQGTVILSGGRAAAAVEGPAVRLFVSRHDFSEDIYVTKGAEMRDDRAYTAIERLPKGL